MLHMLFELVLTCRFTLSLPLLSCLLSDLLLLSGSSPRFTVCLFHSILHLSARLLTPLLPSSGLGCAPTHWWLTPCPRRRSR